MPRKDRFDQYAYVSNVAEYKTHCLYTYRKLGTRNTSELQNCPVCTRRFEGVQGSDRYPAVDDRPKDHPCRVRYAPCTSKNCSGMGDGKCPFELKILECALTGRVLVKQVRGVRHLNIDTASPMMETCDTETPGHDGIANRFSVQELLGTDDDLSLNKKRRLSGARDQTEFKFTDMNGFYRALEQELDPERIDTQLEEIKRVFAEQRVHVRSLRHLTDQMLKECGITQIGLRIAILTVLGKFD